MMRRVTDAVVKMWAAGGMPRRATPTRWLVSSASSAAKTTRHQTAATRTGTVQQHSQALTDSVQQRLLVGLRLGRHKIDHERLTDPGKVTALRLDGSAEF